jgi:hypothetical protein
VSAGNPAMRDFGGIPELVLVGGRPHLLRHCQTAMVGLAWNVQPVPPRMYAEAAAPLEGARPVPARTDEVHAEG